MDALEAMSRESTDRGDSTFSVCDAALEGEHGETSPAVDVEPSPVARPSRTGHPDAPRPRRDGDSEPVHLHVGDGTTVRITVEVLPPE